MVTGCHRAAVFLGVFERIICKDHFQCLKFVNKSKKTQKRIRKLNPAIQEAMNAQTSSNMLSCCFYVFCFYFYQQNLYNLLTRLLWQWKIFLKVCFLGKEDKTVKVEILMRLSFTLWVSSMAGLSLKCSL